MVRTSLRAGASLVGAQEGVAPWDQRRRRPAHDDQAGDRGPGLSPGRDRPGPTRFDPQIGGRALRRYAREHGWAGMLAVARISVRWEQIVGSQVAQHARVEHFAPGRIILRASSSAWAQQLRLLMPGIERAVAGALEPGAGAVEIRVLGPAPPGVASGWPCGAHAGRGTRTGDSVMFPFDYISFNIICIDSRVEPVRG